MIETTLTGKTPDIGEENIKKLMTMFPEVVTEGKVDFEKLKQLLGEYVDDSNERYNFTWNGKGRALRLSQTPSLGTLRPCKEESKNWDTTQNLYIEGDNLEVLKLLQKSYYGKIKMIYIDPPYNTGKDFVYKDDFHDSIENYKRITGQVDGNGNPISTNPETSGRYHTDWLNMMYPRLRLARNLLRDDGVIFISIDDNEVHNLRKICDEIFGESNFEGHIHWRRRHNQPNDKTKMIGLVAEHILAYAKNSIILRESGVGKIDLTGDFSNPDNDPRGDWASKPWKVGAGQSGSRYIITTPTGIQFDEEWMGDEDTFKALLADGRIIFPRDGNGLPRKKYFRFEREEEGQCATNWWSHEMFGHNQGANDCLTQLFGIKNVFSNPKPIELIRGLIQIANVKENDIVLDFFSGSATTAHSVLQINSEDNCNRRFIMVQLQENLDKVILSADENTKKSIRVAIDFLDSINKPHYISEIGKERIRRAGEKIKEEYKDKENIDNLDIGFKVFKLDTSNIRKWQPDYDNLEQSLLDYIDNFVEGRTELDVVYEIMLKYGLDLTYPVDEFTIAGKKVYSIGYGMLMICLDNEITTEVAKGILTKIKELSPESSRVVFKDNGFKSDSNKTNIKEILKSGGIDEFITI